MKDFRFPIQIISVFLLVATLWNSFGWLSCYMMNGHHGDSHHEMTMAVHQNHDHHDSHKKESSGFCYLTKSTPATHSITNLNFFEYKVPVFAKKIQESTFETVVYLDHKTPFIPLLIVSDVFRPPQG